MGDSHIFFSDKVLVFHISEIAIALLTLIALFQTLKILKSWDFNSVSTKQYALEKSAYLVVLIIFFILIFKLVLFPYFAFMVDELSDLLAGAMCGAGVINANEYGMALLGVKLFTLFMAGVWLIINQEDLKAQNYPYTKKKFTLFILIAIFIFGEGVLDYLYLSNIQTTTPVSCCSTIYGTQGEGSELPFGLNMQMFLIIFYLVYLVNSASNLSHHPLLAMLSALVFLYMGYVSVVNFFGTYIYELPTHKCPFCMLQGEYYYVGYYIWSSLFLGVFFSIASYFVKLITTKELYTVNRYSFIFNTIFVVINSGYVLSYYLRNGVFL